MTETKLSGEILERARKVSLLLMDCDGVLTDGRLYFTESGEAMKIFHVRDGQGLALWHQAGFRSGIISGRNAKKILEARATELGIHYIKACSLDKAKDFEDILQDAKVTHDEVAFIGEFGMQKKFPRGCIPDPELTFGQGIDPTAIGANPCRVAQAKVLTLLPHDRLQRVGRPT